jgi:hypothetical protein
MRENPRIVWKNTLDQEYNCYVLEQTDTFGYLLMERIDTGERVLDKEVPISKYFREQDILWWGRECLRMAKKLNRSISD